MVTPHEAQAIATDLLATAPSRRWEHSRGVARRSRVLADQRGADADLLEAAGWLHDVGHAPGLAVTGLHQLDGARYLRDERGMDPFLCRLVAHHSCATFEAHERGLGELLRSEFGEPPEGPELGLLTASDMTTSPDGHSVMADTRIREILQRCGTDSPVHRAVAKAAPLILKTVAEYAPQLTR